MRTREFGAAWWRRRASAAVIVTILLALVGGNAPAVAAPAPVLAQQSSAPTSSEPVDAEYEFYKMLVTDIAEHADDVEVRDAARAALADGTKAKLIWFIDHGEAEARAKAAERKRVEAAQNRAKVQEWLRTGGPNVRADAQAALDAGDQAIKNFVAYGYEIALKKDRQQAEDDKAERDRVIARVRSMVEQGGPQVRLEGEAVLGRGDYALIHEFYFTGYHIANKRDHDFQAAIEQALIDRNKAITSLNELARKTEISASARAEILRANIDAVKNLEDVTLALNGAAKAAHKADEIHRDDRPGRAHGQKGRAPQIDVLRAEATQWAEQAARAALASAGTTSRAQNAGVRLVENGMTYGLDWAKVTISIGSAVEAAARAAETAQHAAEATLADSRALDANSAAQEHAENAKKYRAEAERGAVQAEALAAAARTQLNIAITSRDRAAEQKRIAEAKATQARQHAVNARNQRLAAQSAASNAVAKANSAVAAHGDAVKAGVREQEALDAAARSGRELKTATSVCQGKVSFAEQVETALKAAREEAIRQGQNADEATKDIAAAAGRAREEANASAAWASRAQAAANAAAAAAQAAAQAAQAARAAAARADQEALTARRAADDANRLAMEAVNVAVNSQAAAEHTRFEAEAAISEANSAVWQSTIADRAAAAAAASASMIIDPARMAEVVARPYANINADARKAMALAAKALLIGEEQSRAAQEKATEAAKAAQDATNAANTALEQVKPAYEAAARAAKFAQQAADDAVAATNVAREATQYAAGAHAYASTASQHASAARSDAVGAANAAAVASSAAQSAGLAAAAAEQIHQWATKATATIHKYATDVGNALDEFNDIKQRAIEAQKKAAADAQRKKDELNREFINGATNLVQCVISQLMPGCKIMQDKFNKAMTEGLLGAGDYVKNGIECQGGDEAACRTFDDQTKKIQEFAKNAVDGFVEGAKNTWQGIVTIGNCAFQSFTQQATTACTQIVLGIKDLIENPYKLIHLDTWHENPGKAFGLSVFDVLAAAATTPLGGSGSALSKALNVVRNTISRSTAIIVENLAKFENFLVKIADSVPNKLPGDFGGVNQLVVRVENGVAKITGGYVDVDGRLFKVKNVELAVDGDISRLNGSLARIEADPKGPGLQITIENGLARIEGAKFKFDKLEKVDPPHTANNPPGKVDEATGVWTATEFGQELRLEKAATDATKAFHDKATVSANKIKPQMEKMVGELKVKIDSPTARLEGLQHHIKGLDSIRRKAVTALKMPGATIENFLKDLNDGVRYTVVVDDAKYVKGVEEGIKLLESAGYKKVQVKNAWAKNEKEGGYRGINTTWYDEANGQFFEFQFHTERSLFAKEFEHPWYELRRVPGISQLELDFAEAQAKLLFADVPYPDGVTRIEVFPAPTR